MDDEKSVVPVVHLKGEDPAGILETLSPEMQETRPGRAAIYIERLVGHKSNMEFRLDEFERIAISYGGVTFEINPKTLFERLRLMQGAGLL